MEKEMELWLQGCSFLNIRKAVQVFILCVVFALPVSQTWADDKNISDNNTRYQQTLYDVNLPEQSVAKSLNALARLTGAQFLFPYDLTQSRAAKPVVGRYTLPDAVKHMLRGSGLKSGFDNGILTISLLEDVGEFSDQTSKGSESMKSNTNNKRNIVTSVLAFLFSSSAVAHGADVADNSGGLEEIIVTASKRAVSLQDTSLAVSAISGSDINKLGITSFDQIMSTIPGVTLIETGPGESALVFRGIATDSFGTGGNATTSTYVDDFPLALNSVDIKMVDMAQVEVLKGPQGTLYGQSALGG